MAITGVITGIFGFFIGTIPGFLVSTMLLLLVFWYKSWPNNIPPGPRGIPFLGYLPFLRVTTMPQQLTALSKKFGSIFSIYFGRRLVFVLNGYEANHKALVQNGNAFSGRAQDLVRNMDPLEELNVVFADGLHWREHRRFALSKFRDYGIGRSGIEPAIINEIEYFVEELKKKKNTDLNFRELLSLSICNNVVILELGKRLEYTDPEFIKLKDTLEHILDYSDTIIEQNFPFLAKIPIVNKFFKFEKIRTLQNTLYTYMRKQVEEHRKEYTEGADNDYINAYLTEKHNRDKNNNHSELFDDDTLVSNLKILFFAGMETTTTTLQWGILYMVSHPDIQRKVQKEIDEVIGNERTPSCEDRLRMPYTEAVLLEVQRMGTIVPLNVPHRTTEDVTIDGYTLPGDTLIISNLWSIHYDEKLYPDPQSFRPERFINEDGKVVKPDYLVPFSLGKRFCLGEPLARMELFLYFTAIFQRFTLTHPKSGAALPTEGTMIGVHAPKPYEVHVLLRGS